MKYLFFMLLLVPMWSFGQSAQPFKGANTILIPDTSYEELMKALLQNGFEIKESNETYQTVSTGWKALGTTGAWRIIGVVLDEQLHLQAKWKNDIGNAVFNSQNQEYQMVWKKGGGEARLWDLLEGFASHFGTERMYLEK